MLDHLNNYNGYSSLLQDCYTDFAEGSKILLDIGKIILLEL